MVFPVEKPLGGIADLGAQLADIAGHPFGKAQTPGNAAELLLVEPGAHEIEEHRVVADGFEPGLMVV